MSIKFRLTVLNFLQFFIWGTYLTSLGGYMYVTLKFQGSDIGNAFLTLGIASIIMPGVLGLLADKYINAERLQGICHVLGALALFYASTVNSPSAMFLAMLFVCMAYMPTISLNNTVSYSVLISNDLDPQKTFPPIRVWGTIGFIVAQWLTDLSGWTLTSNQLVFAAGSSLVTGLYCFTLPPSKPQNKNSKNSLKSIFGLDALVLLKEKRMAMFFGFSLLLGAALQVTNQWGVTFIDSFKSFPEYAGTWVVRHSNILISISQISETAFIVTIPFFFRKFGIKKVMLISMLAWVLRFGLFGFGDPGSGVLFLILSMIVYGMAFDFFNISGSLYIEKEADSKLRGSAQGLFMMVTNGIGAMIGSFASGRILDSLTVDGKTDWSNFWYIFATYALLIAVLFGFMFKYKHNPKDVENVSH
jgi:NHS family xanthosine MFS transporter